MYAQSMLMAMQPDTILVTLFTLSMGMSILLFTLRCLNVYVLNPR